MSDYREIAGVNGLAAETQNGKGVRIAVLDTGAPEKAPEEAKIGCPEDKNGHATEISSILFGKGAVVGICGAATPRFFKVLDDRGFGCAEDVARGIKAAIEAGTDIINLSLGFYRSEECPKALKDACDEAYNAGITVVCSSGNDGSRVNWPGALKTTICVGSADKKGLKYGFSSFGEVDFVAPGDKLPVIGLDGSVKYVSGTSFSTAIVSGTAALLFARFKNSAVGTGPEVIKSALRGVAVDVDAPGWDENTGFGLIFGKTPEKTPQKSIWGTFKGLFGIIFGKLLEITRIFGLGK